MSIPSQLPQFVAAARAGALQALALQSGQVLDAKILGPAPNGGTQVEIKGQLLNLVLPTLVKAGETIKLEVQGSGPQMRLALQAASTPAAPQAAGPAPAVTNAPPAVALPSPAPPATVPTSGGPGPAPVATGQPAASPAVPQPVPPTPAAIQPGTLVADAVPQPVPAPVAAPPPNAPAPSLPAPATAPAPATPTPPAAAPSAAAPPTPANPAPIAPYPQTAASSINPLAVAAAATATAPPHPAQPPIAAATVRPVVATTTIANATAHSTPNMTTPYPAPTPQPTTPQAALAQMVQASVPRQGPISALTTALSGVAGRVVLPEPVVRAAQQVLAGRVAVDAPRFDGATLQAAVRSSGVFQEANLARGPALLPPDMKTALLTLRQTLTSWLGQQPPVAAVTQIPPPLRGIIPRARGHEAPSLDPGAPPEEVGKHLLERTESALARVRLHQHASLPDPTGRITDLSMDLPITIGAHQTMLQLQIHRDQHNEAETVAERGWQMRFALSLPDLGEVGAQVSLRGGSVGVMLWATDPDASAALDAEVASLRETLAGAGLRPGAVLVRHGEPPATPSAPSGHFVDART